MNAQSIGMTAGILKINDTMFPPATPKIIPAIPGNVKVASNKVSIPTKRNKFKINVILAISPKTLYLKNIKLSLK